MESKPTVDDTGATCWFNADGEYHRDDGPAIIWKDGSEFWYQYDRCHNINGPAARWTESNSVSWHIDGMKISFEEWCKRTSRTSEEALFLKLKYKIS